MSSSFNSRETIEKYVRDCSSTNQRFLIEDDDGHVSPDLYRVKVLPDGNDFAYVQLVLNELDASGDRIILDTYIVNGRFKDVTRDEKRALALIDGLDEVPVRRAINGAYQRN